MFKSFVILIHTSSCLALKLPVVNGALRLQKKISSVQKPFRTITLHHNPLSFINLSSLNYIDTSYQTTKQGCQDGCTNLDTLKYNVHLHGHCWPLQKKSKNFYIAGKLMKLTYFHFYRSETLLFWISFLLLYLWVKETGCRSKHSYLLVIMISMKFLGK